MGRNSGSGSRGGLQPGDGNYKGKVIEVESLIKMKDPQVYKETMQAISRYHAVLGVRQREVKLAELRTVRSLQSMSQPLRVYSQRSLMQARLRCVSVPHGLSLSTSRISCGKPLKHRITSLTATLSGCECVSCNAS